VSAAPDYLAAEAARLVAVAQAEAEQPARGASKTLRFPKGSDLLAWFETYASDEHLSPNGAIIVALTAFRAAVERGRAEGRNHP
jgi:hypothetical protein